MPPSTPARKPLPSFFGLLYANSCKSAVPTVYYAIFAIYEPLLCVAGMIGAFVDPVKVCIPQSAPLSPTDRALIDASNSVPDSQHERSLASRCRTTRNFARSHDCHHTSVGAHMCFTWDRQFLRPHRNQRTPVSRIAREDGHVAVYPVNCVRRFAYLSDALRYRRHEVEDR